MSGSRLSDWLNSWIRGLKWPLAMVFVLWMPNIALALFRVGWAMLWKPYPMLPFLGGAIFWSMLWWAFLRRSRYLFLLTFEHELTHAIFAWLTLHRVVGLRVTMTQGGHVQYIGPGNWLISLAPYFFPTFSLLLMGIVWLLPSATHPIGEALIGMSFAWHVTSTIRETSPSQPDIVESGRLFALMFLPSAHMLTIGSLLAFAHQGAGAVGSFLFDCVI